MLQKLQSKYLVTAKPERLILGKDFIVEMQDNGSLNLRMYGSTTVLNPAGVKKLYNYLKKLVDAPKA